MVFMQCCLNRDLWDEWDVWDDGRRPGTRFSYASNDYSWLSNLINPNNPTNHGSDNDEQTIAQCHSSVSASFFLWLRRQQHQAAIYRQSRHRVGAFGCPVAQSI